MGYYAKKNNWYDPGFTRYYEKHMICFFKKQIPSVSTGQKSQYYPICVTGETQPEYYATG